MQKYRPITILSYMLMILALTTLACSLLPAFLAQKEPTPRPTRVLLPTFTPTLPIEALISVPPTPTDTPVPPPTEPSPPPAEPQEEAPTNTPEPPPTNTPEPPPPTEPPPPPPTEPPPPPPPAEPVADSHGVIGKISFRDGRNTYAVGEKVFVTIEATNTGPGLESFGVLGLNTSTGVFQTSWDNDAIASGETFRHEDGLPFSSPGTHKIWLSICYSTKQECQGADGDWTRFEPGLDVIVQ